MARFHEREEDLESELNKNAIWSVTYGDLMSYMMIFFLLMFAFSYTKGVKSQMAALSIKSAVQGKEMLTIDELFSKHGLQRIARVELSDQRLRITFLEPVLFDAGSADLKAESEPALHSVADVLRDIKNSVSIEGHTDSTPVHGRFQSNWELSTARAQNVLRYFLEKEHLAPERFSATGMSQYHPLGPNDSTPHRAANRRIEINVLRLDDAVK